MAARSLAGHERAFPYVVLTVGWLGSVIGWLSSLSPVLLDRQRRRQRATMSLLRWSAPVVVLAAYLFSVAGPWAGVYRPGDYVDVALGGLVPLSDARGHFEGPLWQVMTGRFDSWVERRLVAAAMRIAQGSATVAIITAAGIVAPLVKGIAGYSPEMIVLALSCGGTVLFSSPRAPS